MPHRNPSRSLLPLVLLAIVLPACNQEPEMPPTYPVRGQVTVDGKPLADGEIAFVKVSEGIRDMLPIQDGKFEGEVLPGDRKVEIRAYRLEKVGVEMYGDDAPESRVNFIPKKYNDESEFTATITESGPNEFQFEISSQ